MNSGRRGDYGVDAPYAPLMFGAFAIASAVYAGFAWRSGAHRSAAIALGYTLFFMANASSFLYS